MNSRIRIVELIKNVSAQFLTVSKTVVYEHVPKPALTSETAAEKSI